ncbi:MAG: mechanosensitive ion channel [Aphanocapsa sp. GSE-SYN-MK-11-07L]|nr:mechanosensitive ion channel [Aphanocapsa sp. GSE-SYN-MK-11-07L]
MAPAGSTSDSVLLSPMTQFLTALGLSALGPTLLNLIGAIVILTIGWIAAVILSGVVKRLLNRTDIDNRIARSLTGQTTGTQEPKVEKLISSVVFWVILLIAIVAFLDALKLTTVSQPLNTFLSQVFGFLPKLGVAAILAGIAWVLATLAKTLVIRSARALNLDQRVAETTETTLSENQFLLSETLGNVLYWFIFLFFLPLILGVLDLQGPLQPVQNLLNDILAALPRILKALIIAAIGWVLARVVRGIVTNLLTATSIDRVGAQFGLRRTSNSQSLSWLIGTLVYVLILIPTAIAALDALQIPAISAPATSMLSQILSAIPQIFTAALILVIGYVVGRFVADLVKNLLAGIGFDNIFDWIGLRSTPAAPPSPDAPDVTASTQPSAPLSVRTPSDIAGIVVLVGIMLFATVAATNVLNIPALTALISGLLVVFGQVLAGLVVFAVGLYLANLAFNLISSSGSAQARILAQTARIAIIALVSAMALQQMGIAASIVNLAFGLLLGAIAVAIALAFGLGCRGIAADRVERWLASFDRDRTD